MNKSKVAKFLGFSVLILGFLLFGYTFVQKELKSRLEAEYRYHQNTVMDFSNKNDLWVECQTSGDYWEIDGFYATQYDILLHNNSSIEVSDWEISIQIPEGAYLDAYWNGVFQIEDNYMYISAVDYNAILKKQAYPIGFILYVPNVAENISWIPKDISINYSKYTTLQDLAVYWIFIAFAILTTVYLFVYCILKLKMKEVTKRQLEYKDIIEQALSTFANAIDAKDTYTEGHSRRVALYSREIARRMRLSYEVQENIFYIGMMHDIGKIGIPDSILNKPGKLSDEEWEIMKQHPIYSGDILEEFTTIPEMSEAVRYHHEWFDGNGYPYGLKGYDIPFIARIISVADSFDTMNTKRVYRNPLEKQEIINQLKNNSGIQFDPEIIPYMVGMITDGTVDRLANLV